MKKKNEPSEDNQTEDIDENSPVVEEVSMTKEEFLESIRSMTSEDIAKALDEMNPLIGKRYRDSLL